MGVEQKQSFDIHANDWKDVEIVQYDEQREDTHVEMCYASRGLASINEGPRVPKNLCPHTMKIRASAKNSAPIDIGLIFFVDEEGMLKLNRI